MFKAFLLVLLVPAYLFAAPQLTSPLNISPQDLDSDEYISIADGSSVINDLGFKEQRSIVDEILGAVGDLSFSASLLKTDFDLDGNKATARLRARLNMDRRIYVTNLGEVDRNGQPLSPLKSVYTVVDEVKNELRAEFDVALNSVLSVEPLNVHAAIAIKRIYEVGNLAEYRARRTTQENLAEIGVNAEEDQDVTPSYTKKSGQVLKSFNKVLDSVEQIFQKGADYFADEERTKMFLENVLDPLRIDTEFFRLTAEKIRDSKSVQVGEILTHSVSLRILPVGFKLRKDVASLEYIPKSYTIIIHSAFKKISPTEVIAKSILEVRKGREFRASIELMNTGYEPIRWASSNYNYEMNEYGYKFDLSKPQHVDAFNGIFAKRWLSKDITTLPATIGDIGSIQNPEYLIFTKDKSTPITNIDNKFRAEFGVGSYSSHSYRQLEKIENRPTDGDDVDEYVGLTGKITKSRLRIGFKGMKENEQSTRQLKSYVRIDESTSPKAELAFEYLFNDQFTDAHENENYINFLKMAMASRDLVNNSVAMKALVNALDQRLQSKKDKDDAQYLALRISLSTSITNAIFNNPENRENIKYLIGRLFLGDKYKQWTDIRNPRPTRIDRPNECQDLVINNNSLVYNRSAKITCFGLRGLALSIDNSFNAIMDATESSDRLAILNKFFRERYFRAYVPLLILQLATIESVNEDGTATFKSIDSLLQNGDLGLELVLDGAGLEFPLRINYDKTSILERAKLPGDFDFIDINNGERRLQVKGAYIRAADRNSTKPNVIVRLNSNVDFGNNYSAVVSIREFKFARGDRELAVLTLPKLIPVLEQSRNFSNSSAFSYVIEIPNAGAATLAKGQDYVAAVQVLDQNGNFVTEVVEAKFTIK
jgi:hypothetical protein